MMWTAFFFWTLVWVVMVAGFILIGAGVFQ